MASSKHSSTNRKKEKTTTQNVLRNVNSDIFPYPDNKQFKGHGFFMEVIAELKDRSTFSMKNREIDMEDSENVLEYVSLVTRQDDLIERRNNHVVYEDHFNRSVIDMIGNRKFSYEKLLDVCSKYEGEERLQEHIKCGNKKWEIFKALMSEDDARAAAFAIAFYTGSHSYGINRSASVVARKSNGEALEIIRNNDLKDASIILYYLVRGLAQIPYYWGVTGRAINLTEKELNLYEPGTLITWLQFSSAVKGLEPPEYFTKNRNTRFFVYSLTGRSIQDFSIFPDEDEILFLPHSTFLVINHRKD